MVPADTGQLKETEASKLEARPLVKHSSHVQCLSDPTDVVCPVVHSPTAMRTRSHAQVHSDKSCSSSVLESAVSAVDPACDGVVHSTESNSTDAKDSHLVLQLPKDIPDVTQHYIDFVRCEQYVTAMKVKECMQQQWSHIIVPGQKVKVKIEGVLTSGVVKKSHYIAKLSSNSTYFYAAAKVDISFPGSTVNSEFQF